jgi:hypothetical protein
MGVMVGKGKIIEPWPRGVAVGTLEKGSGVGVGVGVTVGRTLVGVSVGVRSSQGCTSGGLVMMVRINRLIRLVTKRRLNTLVKLFLILNGPGSRLALE